MRASAFGWTAQRAPAWGEPSRPGFPPRRGKRERGNQIPCCRRLFPLPRDLFDSGEVVRNPSRSCSVISISDLAVQSSLNPFAPQDLKVVQRRFPVLDGLPLGDHIPQRQVQQLHGGFLARK